MGLTGLSDRIIETDERFSIDQVMDHKGPVLVDTNIFHGSRVLEDLYDLRSIADINEATLEQDSVQLARIGIPLLLQGALVVPEVISEIEQGNRLLEQQYQFRKNISIRVIYGKKKNFKKKRMREKQDKLRHEFFGHREMDDWEEEEFIENASDAILQNLNLRYRVLELMKRPEHNAVSLMNQQQLRDYIELSERLKIKKMRKAPRFQLKGNHQSMNPADEKLVAAAAVLSRAGVPRILSRDPDVTSFLKGFYYSDYVNGFESGDRIEVFTQQFGDYYFMRKAVMDREGIIKYRPKNSYAIPD